MIGDIKIQKKAKVSSDALRGDERFAQELISGVVDVLEQHTLDHDLAAYAELKEVTPAFNVIGQQIHIIKTEIIGDKNKDGSLIKNLGEACETQCGR